MNETELDDMLNKWDAPPVPRGLRERISQEPPRRKWHFRLPSGLFIGLAAGAAMCFIGITAAFPQAVGPTPRFNLISEYLRYKDDGSSTIKEYRASTARNGQEIVLEQTFPDSWLMTLHQGFFLTVHRMLGLNHTPPASMASDCALPKTSVVGQETLLGYQTYKLLFHDAELSEGRYTEWRAPALDCIPMKLTWEKRSGGELKLVDEKRPMTVRINRAQ